MQFVQLDLLLQLILLASEEDLKLGPLHVHVLTRERGVTIVHDVLGVQSVSGSIDRRQTLALVRHVGDALLDVGQLIGETSLTSGDGTLVVRDPGGERDGHIGERLAQAILLTLLGQHRLVGRLACGQGRVHVGAPLIQIGGGHLAVHVLGDLVAIHLSLECAEVGAHRVALSHYLSVELGQLGGERLHLGQRVAESGGGRLVGHALGPALEGAAESSVLDAQLLLLLLARQLAVQVLALLSRSSRQSFEGGFALALARINLLGLVVHVATILSGVLLGLDVRAEYLQLLEDRSLLQRNALVRGVQETEIQLRLTDRVDGLALAQVALLLLEPLHELFVGRRVVHGQHLHTGLEHLARQMIVQHGTTLLGGRRQLVEARVDGGLASLHLGGALVDLALQIGAQCFEGRHGSVQHRAVLLHVGVQHGQLAARIAHRGHHRLGCQEGVLLGHPRFQLLEALLVLRVPLHQLDLAVEFGMQRNVALLLGYLQFADGRGDVLQAAARRRYIRRAVVVRELHGEQVEYGLELELLREDHALVAFLVGVKVRDALLGTGHGVVDGAVAKQHLGLLDLASANGHTLVELGFHRVQLNGQLDHLADATCGQVLLTLLRNAMIVFGCVHNTAGLIELLVLLHGEVLLELEVAVRQVKETFHVRVLVREIH
mmetsp:Transcript_2675/g.6440  ORF Transcript_2675/g.6440 Transcript_2675/m.6440 type:complete len:661 (+) Transcript_2675:504-2486(+)